MGALDTGIWRRLIVIPFEQTIKPDRDIRSSAISPHLVLRTKSTRRSVTSHCRCATDYLRLPELTVTTEVVYLDLKEREVCERLRDEMVLDLDGQVIDATMP